MGECRGNVRLFDGKRGETGPLEQRRSFTRVTDKLREAVFFFRALNDTWDDSEASYYFSAFLSAARSVTFTLQAVGDDLPGFAPWYATQRAMLEEKPAARFLLLARNESQKIGVAPVKYGGVASHGGWPKGNHFYCRRLYRFDELEKTAIEPPFGDAVRACREHLGRLALVVRAAYREFQKHVDPNGQIRQVVQRATVIPRLAPARCPLDTASRRRRRLRSPR